MHSVRSRYPSSSSIPMTWNSSARLTPSPEPSDDPASNERLIHYATPPSSPTALQRSSKVPFARTVPEVMEGVKSRYFGNSSYQKTQDHCEFSTDQRYSGLAEMPQQRSFVPTSRATAAFDQVTYPLEQGYGYQLTATAPHIQDSSRQYDTDHQQINQRQYRHPAYSSSLMYSTVVETPMIQPTVQHLSDFDSVQQYSSSHPPSPSNLDLPVHQFHVPQQYYNAASQPSSALLDIVPAYSIVQPQPLDQSLYEGTSADARRQSLTDARNMSDEQPASDLAESLYGDANYEKFVDLSRKAYRHIQEGRLPAAAISILELSGWLMKGLARFGLTQDDVSRHGPRLQLWKDFNQCWLALLQKQKDLSSEARRSARQPAPPQDLLQTDLLKQMGDELVRICDQAENHGLVDYEMGFWEEEIMTVLVECIDILEGNDSNSPSKITNEMLSKFRRLK